MSLESVRKRLEAATPGPWQAANGKGKFGVLAALK